MNGEDGIGQPHIARPLAKALSASPSAPLNRFALAWVSSGVLLVGKIDKETPARDESTRHAREKSARPSCCPNPLPLPSRIGGVIGADCGVWLRSGAGAGRPRLPWSNWPMHSSSQPIEFAVPQHHDCFPQAQAVLNGSQKCQKYIILLAKVSVDAGNHSG